MAPWLTALSICVVSVTAREGAMQLKHKRVKQHEVPFFWEHGKQSGILIWLEVCRLFMSPVLLGLLWALISLLWMPALCIFLFEDVLTAAIMEGPVEYNGKCYCYFTVLLCCLNKGHVYTRTIWTNGIVSPCFSISPSQPALYSCRPAPVEEYVVYVLLIWKGTTQSFFFFTVITLLTHKWSDRNISLP